MPRPAPRNPLRRNRKLGTAAAGYGQDNRLVISNDTHGAIWFWRDLGEYRVVRRLIQGREVTFLVERTNRGCVHACTVEDIAALLRHVPLGDWEGIALFVLRQPKRKQALLEGVWGRLAYGGTTGRPQDGMFNGPAIFLDATPPEAKFTLRTSMGPAMSAEFERLLRDGHHATRKGSRFLLQCTLNSIRNTQLYRTVLHEIGHWLDWLEKVKRPPVPSGRMDEEFAWREELETAYDRRPSSEREVFANQYADRLAAALTSQGVIPFPRLLEFPDLDPADFLPGPKRDV